MVDVDFILETFATIFLTAYYLLEGIVLALLPAKYQPKKELAGETVLVTGSGNGMGRLLAIKLARLGCKLVLWDINESGNKETANEIKEFGGKAHPYTVDLSKREQIYAVADKVRSEVGEVTILVNNAGIVTGKKFLQCPDPLIEKSMEVNTNAHFWTTKAFLPSMIDRNHGHVVSVASMAGMVGAVGLADYCASKFAAVGFMDSLTLELNAAHKDIQFTTVCPFYVNTGMFDGIKTRFPLMLPILEPDYVVDKIIEAIQTNQSLLCLPRVMYIIVFVKSLFPVKVSQLLNRYFGASSCMDEFRGRNPTRS